MYGNPHGRSAIVFGEKEAEKQAAAHDPPPPASLERKIPRKVFLTDISISIRISRFRRVIRVRR